MPIQGSVIRSRGGYGLGRGVGPIDGNFRTIAATDIFSVASNVFNIYYGITGCTYSESNMRVQTDGTNTAVAVLPKQYGKWAFEFEWVANVGTASAMVGIRQGPSLAAAATNYLGQTTADFTYVNDATKRTNGSSVAYGATYALNDKITILLDMGAGTVSFAKNGTNQGVAYTGLTGAFYPACDQNSGTTKDWRISATLTYAFAGYNQWR